MAHLKAQSTLAIISLEGPLMAAKSHEQVYYRTDSHWNTRGAHVGYSEIIRALTAWFPALEAIPRADFRDVKLSEPGRDLAWLIDMREFYADSFGDIQLARPTVAQEIIEEAKPSDAPSKPEKKGENFVFQHPDPKLPRAVVFRDSFADRIMPMLAENFRRVVFCWQYTFDRELVEREEPDVVIQEFVEHVLMYDPLAFQ